MEAVRLVVKVDIHDSWCCIAQGGRQHILPVRQLAVTEVTELLTPAYKIPPATTAAVSSDRTAKWRQQAPAAAKDTPACVPAPRYTSKCRTPHEYVLTMSGLAICDLDATFPRDAWRSMHRAHLSRPTKAQAQPQLWLNAQANHNVARNSLKLRMYC
jgi:hypothetical protein